MPGKAAGKSKGTAAGAPPPTVKRSASCQSSLSSQSSLDTAAFEQAISRPNTIENLEAAAADEHASKIKSLKIGTGKGRGKEFRTQAEQLRVVATPQQAPIEARQAPQPPPAAKPEKEQTQPGPPPAAAGDTQLTEVADTVVSEAPAGPVVCWQAMYDRYMETAKKVFVSENFSAEYLELIVRGLANQAHGFMSQLDLNDTSATESEGDQNAGDAQQVPHACPATAAQQQPSLPQAVQVQTNDAPQESVPPSKPTPPNTGCQASTTGNSDTQATDAAQVPHASQAIAPQQHTLLATVPMQIVQSNDAPQVSVVSTKPTPNTGSQASTCNQDTVRQATAAQEPHANAAMVVQILQSNHAPQPSVPPTEPTLPDTGIQASSSNQNTVAQATAVAQVPNATVAQVPHASTAIAPQQQASLPPAVQQAHHDALTSVPPTMPTPNTGIQASATSNQDTVGQVPNATAGHASPAITPQQKASLGPAVQQTNAPTKPAPNTGSQASSSNQNTVTQATAAQVPNASPAIAPQQQASLPQAVQQTNDAPPASVPPTKPALDTGSQSISNQDAVRQATAADPVPHASPAIAPQQQASLAPAVQQAQDPPPASVPPTEPTLNSGSHASTTGNPDTVRQATAAHEPHANAAIAPHQHASLPAESLVQTPGECKQEAAAKVDPSTMTGGVLRAPEQVQPLPTAPQQPAPTAVPLPAGEALNADGPAKAEMKEAPAAEQAAATAKEIEDAINKPEAPAAKETAATAQAVEDAINKPLTQEEQIRRQQAHAAYMRFWRSVTKSAQVWNFSKGIRYTLYSINLK